MKVAAVERDDVERLHRKITAEGKTRRANAVLGTVHTLFEQAIKWKMRADNPAKRIERNPEHNRERYLSAAELERLLAALDHWQQRKPDSCDVIRLALLTGARRGEVIGMEWSQLDLDAAGVWSKPFQTTKQRKPHRVPLSPEAIDLLRRRRASRVVRFDDRVFGDRDIVVSRVERDWREIRAAAGLEDVRLHDLRHSFASVLVSQGLSLPIICALLGHSRPSTTNRYAHLADAPLREAAAIVGKLVGGRNRGAK